MKKILFYIFALFFSVLVFLCIYFFIINKNENIGQQSNHTQEFNMLDGSTIFDDNIEIIVNISEDVKTKEEIIINDNLNEVNTSNGTIEIDTGTNLILSTSYFSLNNDYDLIELLVGLETNEYLNDTQLSTSYEYANRYKKQWYIYDKVSKSEFLFFEDDIGYLTLNTIVLDNYLEADIMYKCGEYTEADHIKISIEDLIYTALSNRKLNILEYSIFNQTTPSFDLTTVFKTSSLNYDLDEDGQKDNIIFKFYDNDFYVGTGFSLEINGKIKDFFMDNPNNEIYIVDIDKNDNYKELFITGEYKSYILSYINGNIVETFEGFPLNIDDVLQNISFISDNFYMADLKIVDNSVIFKVHTYDNIQNWSLKMSYILDKNHRLIAKNQKYFETDYICIASNRLDIIVYRDKDYQSEKIVIPEYSQIEFIGTDLKYWGVVRFNEEIYYLPLDENGYIKDLGATCEFIFEGLAIAG